MIRYELQCENNHTFEGWFRDSAAYDAQRERGLLSCPSCGSDKIEKALMAPSVHQSLKRHRKEVSEVVAGGVPEDVLSKIREVRDYLLKNSTDVGDKFSEEVRAMHYEEKPQRQVHGQADHEEIKSLNEEGIAVLPLPRLPDDLN